MEIHQNYSLKPYNTFGIDALAKFFAEFSSIDELKVLLQKFSSHPKLILGGGSNILFTRGFEGLVLKNNILGIQKVNEDEQTVTLKVGAGENWHQFVLYCIEKELAGIENLSLIPGTVGAAPMQNIGAYGVEVKEVIVGVEALHLEDLTIVHFNNQDCKFGYRESIFKNIAKGQYVITGVTFSLHKKPTFRVSYGAIQQTLEAMDISELSIRAISEAVIHIRQSKLPDPKEIGNAGSFFKNPEIPIQQFEQLKSKHPNIPSYPIHEHLVKVPAGWLIDQAGWKGKKFGEIGVHDRQALVLVNHGGGKGQAILDLSKKIQASILDNFGIHLYPEINII